MAKVRLTVDADFLDRVGYAMEVYECFASLCETYFDEDLEPEFMAAVLMVQQKNFIDNESYGRDCLKRYLSSISSNYASEKAS